VKRIDSDKRNIKKRGKKGERQKIESKDNREKQGEKRGASVGTGFEGRVDIEGTGKEKGARDRKEILSAAMRGRIDISEDPGKGQKPTRGQRWTCPSKIRTGTAESHG